ncbi:hypothetical protein EVAR_54706_1 [Eumeta japonica]|uniref:Endonuclease/exonuclease/phosphatase domain-containing protein n=1 Tax=Eumeta variegata TaxID=151549 RepID=A0A4C1YR16_EUMVA|nr:hypothetical protein EVAR_54706_1 [Eumeta japonica]
MNVVIVVMRSSDAIASVSGITTGIETRDLTRGDTGEAEGIKIHKNKDLKLRFPRVIQPEVYSDTSIRPGFVQIGALSGTGGGVESCIAPGLIWKLGSRRYQKELKDLIIRPLWISTFNVARQNVTNIIDFLHESLLLYTEGGSKLLKKRYHELPLLLGGDFNIDFNKEDGFRLVQFLKDELNLDLISDRTLGTTSERQGKTVAVTYTRRIAGERRQVAQLPRVTLSSEESLGLSYLSHELTADDKTA